MCLRGGDRQQGEVRKAGEPLDLRGGHTLHVVEGVRPGRRHDPAPQFVGRSSTGSPSLLCSGRSLRR